MKSVSETMAAHGTRENWIPLIELSAREVFELMLGSELDVPTDASQGGLAVTAMVGLAGQLCGVISVRCGTESGALMASRMLGMNVDEGDAEVSDALGEVCNMVAGNFKNKIAGLAEGCMLSPPTVITGSDYDLHSQADSPTLEVRPLLEELLIVITLQVHG